MIAEDTSPISEALTRALEWHGSFRDSELFAGLSSAARDESEIAVRVLVDAYASSSDERGALETASSRTIIDLLSVQIPRRVTALDSKPLFDAIAAFLTWGVRSGRIREKGVEHAVKKVRGDAEIAMRDERRWSTGKSIVVLAMRDGIDPGNVDRLRAHALARGLDAALVDAALPPPPVRMSDGRWLYAR